MKIHGRKLVALLLAAAVLLNLTACGKRENAPYDKMEICPVIAKIAISADDSPRYNSTSHGFITTFTVVIIALTNIN